MFVSSGPRRGASLGIRLSSPTILFACAAAALCAIRIVSAHQVLNLVAEYGFSESAGTTVLDASGSGNTATLMNGALWGAGKYGTSVVLDGTNDFVSVPDAASLDIGSSGTLEAWVQLTAINRWNGVLGKTTSSADEAHNYAIEIGSDNKVNCVIGNGAAINVAKSTTALAAQRFYHLACTWDGTQLKLYLDGVLNKTTAQTLTPLSNNGPLYLGQYGGNVDFLRGKLDDVRVYNIAIPQAEIVNDMNLAVESTPDVTNPIVTLTSPAEGTTVSAVVPLVAAATDDRVVAGVTFFLDGTQFGVEDTVEPYTTTWDTATAINGSHVLYASARDASGNVAVSATSTVNVVNAPHLVITKPANGANVSSASLDITYIVSGDTTGYAVNHVHFQLDGGPEIMDLPPMDGMYTMTGVAPGSHVLTGFLVRSNHTKIVGTDSTAISFVRVVPDSTPPVVSITSPSAGAAVTGTVALIASATDNVSVSGVQFYVDGAPVGAEDTSAPYSTSWAAVGIGTRTIAAVARDLSGNVATSAPVSVEVTDPNDPATIGQWSSVMNWPIVAVHMNLMPSSEILMWDGWELPFAAAKLWNPAAGIFSDVTVSAGVFCSAQAILSDGKVLVVGGHSGGEIGIPDTFTFDPASRMWSQVSNMVYQRWYPSATRLGDGRVVSLSGQITPGVWADKPEIYDPRTDRWATINVNTANMHDTEYPLTFLVPDGRVFVISPQLGQTYALDVATPSWTSRGVAPMSNGVAAMYRPGKVLMSGGGVNGVGNPSRTTASRIDMTEATPTWRTLAPMAYGRFNHNLVVLANGDVLAVGGSVTVTSSDTVGTLPAELWSATSETWSTMAAMHDPRMYHSTAMLLPDGRVLVAGGGRLGSVPSYPTAEIYSPPYLFRGPRPTIATSSVTAPLGGAVTIDSPDATTVARVALVPLAAVTHTLNMNQTYVDLPFTVSGTTITATVPTNANAAPPGYYLLFMLNSAGTPAIAPFIRIIPAPDVVPPTVAVTSPSSGAALTGPVTVTANASDNQDVAEVQFQVDGQNIGAADTTTPYSTTWNTGQQTNGAHTVTAIARDAAGNSAVSAGVPVTLSNVAGGSKTFGHAVVGGLIDTGAFNYVNAWRFVMPNESGTASSLSVYINSPVSAAPNNQFQVAVYADQNGVPGALLASTASRAIVADSWNTVPLTVALQPNVAYWLGYNTNAASAAGNNVRLDAGAIGQMAWRAQTFGTWPAAFGQASGQNAYQGSIFLIYDASGTMPRLGFTSPAEGATVAGSSVNVSYAITGDATAVSQVVYSLDGGAAMTDPAPFDGLFPLTGLTPGAHTLAGYLGNASQTKISGSDATALHFTVALPDSTFPAVSLTAPTTGTTSTGNTTVSANASDNIGVASVQFQVDGQNIGAADTTAPYSIVWDTTTVSNGMRTLTAIARDAAGNATTSAPVTVTVSNTAPPTILGYSTLGASLDSGAANHITTWRFIMPNQAGTASSLSVYIGNPISASPSNQFQVAVYADQGGAPGTLIVSTTSQAIVGNSWNTVPLAATLQPNTAYWLAYNTNAASDSGNNVRYDPGVAGQARWRAQTFGTWPATFGTPGGSAASQASIFLTVR